MHTISAIRAMLDKKVYQKYGPVLFQIDNLQHEHQRILATIKKYYKRYEDQDQISVDALETYFTHLYPQVSKPDFYREIFSQFRTLDVDNPELVKDVLNGTVQQHLAAKIYNVADQIVSGQISDGMEKIIKQVKKYEDVTDMAQDVEDVIYKVDIPTLLEFKRRGGLNWRVPFFNRTIGPIKGDTLGHVFGRSNSGKTSFILSEVTNWAWQVPKDRPILYLHNEENIARVALRAVSAMTGCTEQWVDDHPDQAVDIWGRYGGDNIKFIPQVNFLWQVERYIEMINPSICIIDQGKKIMTPTMRMGSDG
jgi:hypothetical protein